MPWYVVKKCEHLTNVKVALNPNIANVLSVITLLCCILKGYLLGITLQLKLLLFRLSFA